MKAKTKNEIARFIDDIKTYFLNREDVLAAKTQYKKWCPIEAVNLDDLLISHLTGAKVPVVYKFKNGPTRIEVTGVRLGTYAPNKDAKTRWLCFDLDGGKDHAHPLPDPVIVLKSLTDRLDELFMEYHIEKSHGGDGWHLWIFFSDFVPADLVRRFGQLLIPVEWVGHKGLELFPKSSHAPKSVGTQVALPFHHSAKAGCNSFYEWAETELVPSRLPEISGNSPSMLMDNIADLDRRFGNFESKDGKNGYGDDTWKSWRKVALSKLDLKKIYSDLLTGKTQDSGWLECRDPNSKSGDQHPSAGVNDSDLKYERGIFHSFISGESMSVFDFMVDRGIAKDFRHALQLVSEMTNTPLPMSLYGSKGLPVVLVNCRQPREVIENFWDVLHEKNQKNPDLFRRGNFVVEPTFDELGNGSLVEMTIPKLSGLLFRSCDLVKKIKRQIGPATLPDYVPRDMTTIPDMKLPSLNTIYGSPYFSKKGELVISPGYHGEDEVFLRYPNGFLPLTEINTVSADEARHLVDELLFELTCDFPFASDLDRIHTLIAFFQPPLRKMIAGPTPMLLINAAIPGSGKSLLAQVASVLATGDAVPARVLSNNEDERKKMFLSELLRGRSIILLDNLDDEIGESFGHLRTGKLHSPSLAAILTSMIYTDRILGFSKMVQAPNEALWLMTGNNPQLSLELIRRSVSIRIEANTERPWDRGHETFRHPELLKWVKENRRDLLEKILTAIHSWIAAGQPTIAGKTYGSYESWSLIMRSLLGYLGFEGFLSNQGKVEVSTDPLRTLWIELFSVWFKHFGSKPVTTSDILSMVGSDFLSPLIGQFSDETSRKISLGKQLSKQKGRVYGGYKIALISQSEKDANRYCLLSVDGKKVGGSQGVSGDLEKDINWNGKEGEFNE